MYNRYIRTETGSYTRIPQEEHGFKPQNEFTDQSRITNSHAEEADTHAHKETKTDQTTGIVRQLLDQFHLNHIDAGDLFLLLLIFLLIRENADEELLIALGLLLIL